jgi:hypothetical protein
MENNGSELKDMDIQMSFLTRQRDSENNGSYQISLDNEANNRGLLPEQPIERSDRPESSTNSAGGRTRKRDIFKKVGGKIKDKIQEKIRI